MGAMIKHIIPLFAMLSVCTGSVAQQELTDTIMLQPNQTSSAVNSTSIQPNIHIPITYQPGATLQDLNDSTATVANKRSKSYTSGYPTLSASLSQWNNGMIVATGQRETMPGLMNIDRAFLSVYQQLGPWDINAYGAAAKYGYFRGLSTQWGFGGSITYHINDNMSLSAFGAYYTATGIQQPAMYGYVGYPMFGGYVNYHPENSHFGVKVGAQNSYNRADRHHNLQPIIMPYYKLSNGAELGIDLGGILYNLVDIFHHKSNGNVGGYNNPAIAPPKSTPIGPRPSSSTVPPRLR
jgi:hypothetical protein